MYLTNLVYYDIPFYVSVDSKALSPKARGGPYEKLYPADSREVIYLTLVRQMLDMDRQPSVKSVKILTR